MKLLVIGSGGREHALVWKLAQSPQVTRMWCAPGNAGIAAERLALNGALVELVNLSAEDLPGLVALAHEHRPDLTVVGPDNPLALGLVDRLQEQGLRVWGPNQRAARFESSKAFAQTFMDNYEIPTARAGTFTSAGGASRFAAGLGGRCAIKADGLALGKGVFICKDMAQADAALESIMVRKHFGAAGDKVVVQELLEGIEVSIHLLCDGKTARLFPSSQDHKRAQDGDLGPNTGGMGTYAPTPFVTPEGLEQIQQTIVNPWLKGCAAEGIDYRGLLYPGIMLTSKGPKVLEFNARFGDPETQVYLPLLENDLVELFNACVDGTLDRVELKWRPLSAVCVVMASAGYPGHYVKGKPITGIEAANALPHTKVFHAGTGHSSSNLVTNGGRVLGVTAWGSGLRTAQQAAYHAVDHLRFEGAQYRHDIAAKALK